MRLSTTLIYIIVILAFTFCNASSQSNDKTTDQLETPCDKLYVGIWESEKITKDYVEIKGSKDKNYLKISKPDKYYRVYLKAGKGYEYKQLGNLFQTFFGLCDQIFQAEKAVTSKNDIFYDKETDKLTLRSTPYAMGYPEQGEMKVTYHRLK